MELNPVRANMVATPADYRWSSYCCNGLGKGSRLWTPHEAYLGLAEQDEERLMVYESLFKAHMGQDTLESIRAATNQGLALGSERFKAQVEALTGRRVTARKRGPKKNAKTESLDKGVQEFLLTPNIHVGDQ
jgi:putative transposase